jgi:hypothetical protein
MTTTHDTTRETTPETTRETTHEQPSRDADHWARPVDRLTLSDLPAGAMNLNVHGKQLTGPLQGFGQLWQKTFWVRLSGASVAPAELIGVWKAEFPHFWPSNSKMYLPLAGIAPGEVGLINTSGPGNVTVMSTGIMVIYADEESFAFMTPAGHPFNGMVTFSAHENEGSTVAQVQLLMRAYDPLWELAVRLGVMHRAEDQMWHHTLRSLAARFSVDGQVQQRTTLVDPRVRWSEAGNIWHNAGIRTGLYLPVAMARRLIGRA